VHRTGADQNGSASLPAVDDLEVHTHPLNAIAHGRLTSKRNRTIHHRRRSLSDVNGSYEMRKVLMLSAIGLVIASRDASAQVDLSAYADANGYIDVQVLTCAQLANTWQQDADKLTTWYSGWYNGLARKHYLDVRKGKEVEHEVIEYCKAHQNTKIIDAIAVIFKDERARLGIKMK
jgi:hypothetical protein